jgi:adenylosuccinate synthase
MNIAVIGAQWGDEGKGKIVDFLASEADVIIRFSGGANAGHTIVKDGKKYAVHLIPSGILYEGKTVILGIGMVIDAEAMFKELSELESKGVNWRGRVFVSDRAHIVLPGYKDMDKKRDAERLKPIGTTGRGIGVAYANKSGRDGMRVVDMYDDYYLSVLEGEDKAYVAKYRELMRDMLIDLTSWVAEKQPPRILLEGAQGVLLDLDLGTYPFVSSGVSAAAGAALGAGIGPRQIDGVLGVCKAYSTRVGNGPFPSEFRDEADGDLGDKVRELGGEYGVTTGRPRRCGYLDLVALKYACQANGIDGIVLTKMDIYDSFDEIKACVAYEIDGQTVHSFPASIPLLEKARPVLKTFRGWKKDITKAAAWEDLPPEAQSYVEYIESYTKTPVTVVSVGQDRLQTIIRKDPWTRY